MKNVWTNPSRVSVVEVTEESHLRRLIEQRVWTHDVGRMLENDTHFFILDFTNLVEWQILKSLVNGGRWTLQVCIQEGEWD